MDKLTNFLKSCIIANYLVPNQFVPSKNKKGCRVLNLDLSKFDLAKAISLIPKDKRDAGVTVILFEAGFNEKTRKPFNASCFVGIPNAKDESHIAEAMDF